MSASPTATAPGKILLAGEYAILDGAEAVVFAVDRHARAHVAAAPAPPSSVPSPFLAAARAVLAAHYRADDPAVAAAARIVVDSSALCAADGQMLGLGSSAAATVAAVGCALAAGRRRAEPALVHELAHAAHATAPATRGARGSGADVAAAVFGGALAVRAAGADRPMAIRRVLLPPYLPLVTVWTGAAADTASLVARVRAFATSSPRAYAPLCAALADAAQELLTALTAPDPTRAAIAAVRRGHEALFALGRATGLALVTDTHIQLARLADRHGGAVKPTGAGAGDIACAVLPDAGAAAAFRAELASLPLGVAQGVAPGLAQGPRGRTGILDLGLRVAAEGLRVND
jgi:phosphomevalonate kinase